MNYIKTSALAACAAILVLVLGACSGQKHDNFIDRLNGYIATCDAEIGVCVVIEDNEIIMIDGRKPFPMQSVVKLFQAIAVIDEIEDSGLTLEYGETVDTLDLHRDTYSPLRDSDPDGGFYSYELLLDYSLRLSDNNASDILYDRLRSVEQCDSFLHENFQLSGFKLAVTERQMHENHDLAKINRTTPFAAAMLINEFFNRGSFRPDLKQAVEQMLYSCQTGANRLPAGLKDTEARIAHKTGTGFADSNGIVASVNDVGYVVLPDSTHYAISVLVNNSRVPLPETEAMIAHISKMVYEYVMSLK